MWGSFFALGRATVDQRNLRGACFAVDQRWSELSLTFLSLIKTAGNTTTFLIYAAFCIVTLLFVRFIVPETKGRELETISSDTRPYSTSGARRP